MTITSQVRKAGPYEGNDSTSVFPFTFKVFKAADMLVVRRDDNAGVDTTLILTTDYTVSLNADQNANPGGNIVLVGGVLASGFSLVISSDIPLLQETDLTNQGGFYPKVITNALDRLTIFCQQLSEKLGRALTLPITAPTGVSTDLPFPVPNNAIGWNANGTALQNINPADLATVVAYGNTLADQFTGDGAATQFTLSANPGGINNMDVSVNGVTQRPGYDYSWDFGTGITFAVAPPAPSIPGAKNILVRFAQALPFGTAAAENVIFTDSQGSRSLTTELATKARYVATIAALINTPLALGEVVNVGGYYNVLDYSHHTRVIAAADDGTGVQLANGRWANIKHNGEVDFSWSGARTSDADVSAKVQKFIDAFACKADVVVRDLYTMTAKVRFKQGMVWRGPNQVNGLNVGGTGPTATPPVQQNGFILKSINGWAFDSSIYKLVSGNWIRQDDFIGKAGDIYDGSTYRAVNNCHFKDLTFISADVLDPGENPALETFGAINLNGSNGSTVKGCYVIGTILGVCVSGSWGHDVEGNLLRCKLAEYVSYWCSWTKASGNYCSSFNNTLDWTTRFAPYAAKLPVEMTQVRGFAAGQSPFGKTITNMVTINSSTVFEDNFTERGVIGYGVQDEDTHWVPTFRGGRGEFHTILYAARTGSALKFTFDFVVSVTHLVELFQTKECVNEICGSVNRPSTYGNIFNFLQGPTRPFLILKGLDKSLLDATSATKVMRSEYIGGQNVEAINALRFWNDAVGPDCGIAPLDATNGVPVRTTGSGAGCVPIKVTVAGNVCYGIEVFAGTSINGNGLAGSLRLFYLRSDNTLRIQAWDNAGAIKAATIALA